MNLHDVFGIGQPMRPRAQLVLGRDEKLHADYQAFREKAQDRALRYLPPALTAQLDRKSNAQLAAMHRVAKTHLRVFFGDARVMAGFRAYCERRGAI